MVSTYSIISKSSSPCTNAFMTAKNAPISCSIVSLFCNKVEVLISLFVFFQFYSVTSWNGKVPYSTCSLFCLLLFGLVGNLFVSQNPKECCASHFLGQIMRIPLVRRAKFKLLTQFPEDHPADTVESRLIPSLCRPVDWGCRKRRLQDPP